MMSSLPALDTWVLHALYSLRDLPVVYFFIGVTELGSMLTIGGLAGCAALVLFYRRLYGELAGLMVSVGGSAAVVFALKQIVHRARPDLLYQAYRETDFSFPSGHAAMSVAFYGFLLLLLLPHMRSRAARRWLAAATILLAAGIGFSRLYLGVHYLTDVVASWFIAALFVWLGLKTSQFVKRRARSSEAPYER